jgi:hypothetical protein
LTPTVGIAATGFCYPGGILQLFHRQDQQILRLRTAARRIDQSSTSVKLIIIGKDHHRKPAGKFRHCRLTLT